MVKAKKRLISGLPRINLNPLTIATKPSEPSLLLTRIKELDREFARQTKQLAKAVSTVRKKLTDHRKD
jgi:hypothetical protein